MSEIGLFVSSRRNFNIVVHMEARTRATFTVLTQELTVCAGVKVEVVCRLQGRLAYNIAAHTRDTYCETCAADPLFLLTVIQELFGVTH